MARLCHDVRQYVAAGLMVARMPGDEDLPFDIDPFVKLMILQGTDELGYLLSKEPRIAAWEAAHEPRIDTRIGSATAS